MASCPCLAPRIFGHTEKDCPSTAVPERGFRDREMSLHVSAAQLRRPPRADWQRRLEEERDQEQAQEKARRTLFGQGYEERR